MNNPFAQSPACWKVRVIVPQMAVAAMEEAFADFILGVLSFEIDEAKKIWSVDCLIGEKPVVAEIVSRLAAVEALLGITIPAPEISEVPKQDWLSLVARDFPALRLGRFYVHGAHEQTPPPQGAISLLVDAGMAFGSGEHGTTEGCLRAIERLSHTRKFTRILDMGCGSAILGMAAAKVWKRPVLAVDIDQVSVKVSSENVARNGVKKYVKTHCGDGYKSRAVQGKYDLILANILARPLMQFAKPLARHLQPDGMAVLSGLITSQANAVLWAHRTQGLRLAWKYQKGEWVTLVLVNGYPRFRGDDK